MSATAHKENATARVTLLMTPTEKRTLFAQAKSAGFDSVAAYLRNRAFGPAAPEIDALIDLVNESTQRATVALDRAIEAVDRSIKGSEARDKAIREATLAEWQAWTPAQQAAIQQLFAGTRSPP